MDREALDAWVRHIPRRRVEDVRLQAQQLRAAEDIAVLPIDLAGGAVRRRILRRRADGVGQAVLDVDLVGEAAIGVERRPFGDAHPAHGRNLADAAPGVLHGSRRIRIARLNVEERARDCGVETVRSLHRGFAERRDRTRISGHSHVHHLRRVIDDRSDRLDLGEGPALVAEPVDDPRLSRAQVACDRRVARLEADDPRRQLILRELSAGGVDDANRAQAEQRAGIDLDDDGRDGAVAIALRRAGERRDVARGA